MELPDNGRSRRPVERVVREMLDRPCRARSPSPPLPVSLNETSPSYAAAGAALVLTPAPSDLPHPPLDDLHRRRDIIMETDVTYLNETRGATARG